MIFHGCSLGWEKANPSNTCNTCNIRQYNSQHFLPGMDFTLRGNGRSIKSLGPHDFKYAFTALGATDACHTHTHTLNHKSFKGF